jgi:DNA mismatch repair protein MutS2
VTFAPGDEVHVTALGKGVVREARNGGRYLVELKGRSVVAHESQLTFVAAAKRAAAHANTPATSDWSSPARSHVPLSLDLHGMTGEEAIAALDAYLNDALLAGHPEVTVIHGRSGGTLKRAVHARLKQLHTIRAFRVDPLNPGLTIVNL